MIYFGLRNPGKQYEATRHNAGAVVLDALAAGWGVQFAAKKKLRADVAVVKARQVVLAKSQTFMNESGDAVSQVLRFFSDTQQVEGLQSLFVFHDDLDLALGSYKIQFGTGPKVHNGLHDCYRALGTDQFWHVRIGIDERQGDRSIPGKSYVLQKLSPAAQETLTQLGVQQIEPHLRTITQA